MPSLLSGHPVLSRSVGALANTHNTQGLIAPGLHDLARFGAKESISHTSLQQFVYKRIMTQVQKLPAQNTRKRRLVEQTEGGTP
jgi:hypothetical protein